MADLADSSFPRWETRRNFSRREIVSESAYIKPDLDYYYSFPIDFVPNKNPFVLQKSNRKTERRRNFTAMRKLYLIFLSQWIDMLVGTVFLSILSQMEFHLVQNQKKNVPTIISQSIWKKKWKYSFLSVHTEKYFPNLVKSNKTWLLLQFSDWFGAKKKSVCILNQSENGKYNPILVNLTKMRRL